MHFCRMSVCSQDEMAESVGKKQLQEACASAVRAQAHAEYAGHSAVAVTGAASADRRLGAQPQREAQPQNVHD